MSLLTRLGVRVAGTLIGRRPGLNFVAGSNVSISGADNPGSGRVDITISALAGGSSTPVFGQPDGYLVSDINAGDTTFTLASAPGSLFNTRDLVVLVDPGTNAEARELKSLSSATFTVDSGGPAFAEHHSAGAPVYLVKNRTLYPWMFHAKADRGISDDWQQAQRCILECAYSGCAYEGGEMLFIRQPLYFGGISARSFTFRADEGSWTTKQPGIQYMAKSARATIVATCTASDNKVTFTDGQTPGGLGLTVGKKIALSQPYPSRTLPGGIVSGAIYAIEAVGANYVTLKHLQATGTVGTQVDITSDGTAIAFSNMDSLIHTQISYYRFNMYITDVGGLSVLPQQLSSMRDGFFESFSSSTTPRQILMLDVGYSEGGGQEGVFDNLSMTCGANMVGLAVGGTGYVFNGNTPIVNSTGAPGILCTGQLHTFQSLWGENEHEAVITFVGNADAILIGTILNSSPSSAYAWVDETSNGASATIGKVVSSNSSAKIGKATGATPYDFQGWNGSGAHHDGASDGRNVAGPFSLGAGMGIALADGAQMSSYTWRTGSDGTTLNTSLFYKSYMVDTTGGALSVSLKDQDWIDYTFALSRVAGSNSITVTPATGQIMLDNGTLAASMMVTDNMPRRWAYNGTIGAWVRAA